MSRTDAYSENIVTAERNEYIRYPKHMQGSLICVLGRYKLDDISIKANGVKRYGLECGLWGMNNMTLWVGS